MTRDELIRRAMMQIRNGYAVGGKPGESAMARAEASRGVSSSSAGNVGGVRDGGFGGAGVGSLGGGGGGNALSSGMMAGSAGRDGGGGTGARQVSNVGAKGDFGGPLGEIGPFGFEANRAAKGNFLGSGPTALNNYVSPSPDIGTMAFNRALASSYNDFPNLTGTSLPVGVLAGVQNPARPETINPAMVDFSAAATNYNTSMPVQNPKTLSEYMGSMSRMTPVNGPIAQTVNPALKGDFLGTPTDRIAQARAVQTSPLASYMGDPAFSNVPSTQMASAPSMPNIGAMKSAEYQAMANAIKGYTPEQKNQLAFGSAYSTRVPNEVGQMIAGLKAAASNPNISPAQKTKMEADIKALQAMGGIAVSPGSRFAPTPPGFTVNPQTGAITKAPDYNVVAGPYASMDSPVGAFKNISFAMPKSVALTQPGIAANPNYNPMAGMMAAAPTAVAQGPQNILSSNYQYDGTPANAAYKAPEASQYAYDGTPANAVYKAPAANQYVYDGTPANAFYNAGVAPPVQTVQASSPAPVAKAPQVTQDIVANKLADAFRYGGDRDTEANRERNTTRTLLNLGYTQEQIAAMTPEQIKEILKGKTPATATTPAAPAPVVAANGGRIQYKKGGEATSSTSKDTETGSYKPMSLPSLPEYRPYTLPQYTMPSASPLIADFMGSLSQPIPPVQMPQYQSMVSPLQNTQSSFVNPAMGNASSVSTPGAGFGVNALRYNPMLMNERPDYALTENNSLSNALRLMRG